MTVSRDMKEPVEYVKWIGDSKIFLVTKLKVTMWQLGPENSVNIVFSRSVHLRFLTVWSMKVSCPKESIESLHSSDS